MLRVGSQGSLQKKKTSECLVINYSRQQYLLTTSQCQFIFEQPQLEKNIQYQELYSALKKGTADALNIQEEYLSC